MDPLQAKKAPPENLPTSGKQTTNGLGGREKDQVKTPEFSPALGTKPPPSVPLPDDQENVELSSPLSPVATSPTSPQTSTFQKENESLKKDPTSDTSSNLPFSSSQSRESLESPSPSPSLAIQPPAPADQNEEVTLPSTPTPKRGMKTQLLPIIGILLVIGIGISSFLLLNSKQPQAPQPKPKIQQQTYNFESYKDNQVIATVSEEKIYGKDFHYIVETVYLGSLDNKGKAKEEIAQDIVNYLIDQSVLLQEGASQGWVTLTDNIFNNLDKDQDQRLTEVEKIKKFVEAKEKVVTFSLISIWCQNVEPPEIPLVEARTLAQEKINSLHQKILDGEISLEQAGEIIKNDTALIKLDKNYKNNAYQRYENYKLADISSRADSSEFFAQLNDQLEKLGVGRTSKVIHIMPQLTSEEVLREEYFFIVNLEKQSGDLSFEQWLVEAKTNVNISINQ